MQGFVFGKYEGSGFTVAPKYIRAKLLFAAASPSQTRGWIESRQPSNPGNVFFGFSAAAGI